MKFVRLVFLWIICLVACRAENNPAVIREDPVLTTKAFLETVRREECESVWDYFSETTQEAIIEESDELKAFGYGSDPNGNVYTDVFEPVNLYCKPNITNILHHYEPGSVKLVSNDGVHATVSVKVGEPGGFLIPGFYPIKTIYHDREMHLIKEDGVWKIEL